MARNSELSAKATQTLGLPEGIKFYQVAPFAGMNVKDAPVAVQDSEFVYLENFVKLGDGSLRTVWDAGTALYTATGGKSIVYYTFFTIGTAYYVFIVLSDGSGVQVNMTTGVQTAVGSGKPFYNSATGNLPCARQWGSTYLVISNNNSPNDYWAWDGSILYGAGTAAPNGVTLTGGGYAYGTTPTVTAYGGSGSGMVFTPQLSGGSVTGVTITNPGSGYAPNDIVQLEFTGGSSDNGAQLAAVLTATGVGGVTVAAGGSGYAAPPAVNFSGGGGSGAAAFATVTGGVVTGVTVTNGGSGYTSAPGVSFSGGGGSGAGATSTITGVVSNITLSNTTSGAGAGGSYGTPNAVITGGGGSGATASLVLTVTSQFSVIVSGITITNPGSGYTSPPTVTINAAWISGSATATAQITNAVNNVSVSPGGSGYAQNPTVGFSGGGGASAAGTVVISNSVTAIGVTAGGTGYTTPPGVVFSSGGGMGAAARAVTTNGRVTSIVITNGGQNYSTPPSISFVGGGGGSGAAATAIISGSVAAVNVTTPGSGYTSLPTVTISGGGGSGAVVFAALKPTNVAAINVTAAGTNFTAAPTLTVTGGGGSGCTATANLASGGIGSVTVGGSGGKGYTSPPAVKVAAGQNNAAYGAVALMPYGVSGSCLEMFGSHVWLFNPAPGYNATIPPGTQYVWSAPNVVWDFATSDGGGAGLSTDSFLQTQFVNARQSAGYLYIYGDGSASAISNLTATTAGSTVTTTFTYSNVDPQIGLSWRDSLQEYGRTLVSANDTGVYGLYGGTMRKVSEKLDQILSYQGAAESNVVKAVYPAEGGVTPSSATAHIYNVKYYLNLITIYDPSTNSQRNVMVAWNEKDWCVLSQTPKLTSIATQKIGSFYYAWGSDGTSIYPLFNTPSTTLTKKFTTKYYGADRPYIQKQSMAVWLVAQDASGTGAGVTANVTLQTSGIAPLTGSTVRYQPLSAGAYADLVQEPAFQSLTPAFGLWGTSAEGVAFTSMGVNLTTTSPDFTLANLILGYLEVAAYYG